jgi:hypothetical protein
MLRERIERKAAAPPREQPLIVVLPDGIRLYVRGAGGVPRAGEHVVAMGVCYRVKDVVWRFGRELQDGDLSVPAMPTEILLEVERGPAAERLASPSSGPPPW